MPIYEYVCRDCGAPLERLQKLSDAPLTDCPKCGQPALKRKVSAAGFRLSGGGWYETDFKSDGKRNIAGEKANGSGKPDGAKEKGNGSSDPKPAAADKGGKSDSAASKSGGPSSAGSGAT